MNDIDEKIEIAKSRRLSTIDIMRLSLTQPGFDFMDTIVDDVLADAFDLEKALKTSSW